MGTVTFPSGRALGKGPGALFIAEAGVNHNGDLELARQLIDAAAQAGADAIKFQTFRADQLVTKGAPKAAYQAARDASEGQHAMLAKLELSAEDHRALARRAAERGLIFLSSPFDESSVDLLAAIGVPALKLGSGELTHGPLLAHGARTGLPLMISTGMAHLAEVEEAVATARRAGAVDIAVLHCVSRYPAPIGVINLRAMDTLRGALPGTVVGYSDHSVGPAACAAAAARGAEILEKHLTLDKGLPGPDHGASADPPELAATIALVREVELSLGTGVKGPVDGEDEMRRIARRSLHLARPVRAGATLGRDDLIILRPADGLAPGELERVLGKRACRDLEALAPLLVEDLQAEDRHDDGGVD